MTDLQYTSEVAPWCLHRVMLIVCSNDGAWGVGGGRGVRGGRLHWQMWRHVTTNHVILVLLLCVHITFLCASHTDTHTYMYKPYAMCALKFHSGYILLVSVTPFSGVGNTHIYSETQFMHRDNRAVIMFKHPQSKWIDIPLPLGLIFIFY
jgi:hypothetical protein